MTPHTPLEQALIAWTKVKDPDNAQPQFDDAAELGETRVFSNRNIAAITGLSTEVVGKITGKTDKSGGRLNPEYLQDAYDMWLDFARDDHVNPEILSRIHNGISLRFVAKLTGIPYARLQRTAAKRSTE
jgi:hypothetical protein